MHRLKNFVSAIFFIGNFFSSYSANAQTASAFVPPASPRAIFNFNADWKFKFGDSAKAAQPRYNDAKWNTVSLPHTWNDTDTYRSYISHSGGDQSEHLFGVGWYRKHFRLPEGSNDKKVFLQFDGLRQAAKFYLNGQYAGIYENGITAVGIDITPFVKFDNRDNIIAVRVDNCPTYKEESTGTPFEWNSKDFNPNFGGLNRDAELILTGKIYQTLPLFENLRTTGVYVYPEDIDLVKKTASINVEAEVKNETSDYASVTLSAVVVNKNGMIAAKLDGNTSDLTAGQSEILKASGRLADAHFWDVDNPYLYRVYSILSVDGKVVDVNEIKTGFRKTEFKGGAGTGGVYLNGRFLWLTGYSQRSANDWAGLGGAYPDWMHDFTLAMAKESNANYVRWMHVAPQLPDVEACDKFGIVQVCPAGDKERLVTGRQWEQRAEVMKATIIFYRNNPSIFFWEAGNTIVAPEQMKQMVNLRKALDPHGGRVMGIRDNDQSEANKALTPIAEYYGVMIGQAPQTDKVSGDQIFRGYSIARRDRAPLIETEDFRDEAGRDVWDDYSPPHFGFKPKTDTVTGRTLDAWHWNSETFCLAAAVRYTSYLKNRIDNKDSAHSKWSAYSSIYFTDSDADGRQQGSYVLRVSGKVDAVRLPKSLYYVSRVMQSKKPDIHIIGHWTYPAGTVKTMFVAASHCDEVQLFINGKPMGTSTKPYEFADTFHHAANTPLRYQSTGFIYAFPKIAFVPGTIKAVAKKDGKVVASDELETAGAPNAIKLILHTGPNGLLANGSDVALIDFEIVDAKGRLCPTDESRVDFTISGPGIWRGGINGNTPNSTNNLYLNTECGINRVAIRSTLTPGNITLTAYRKGLKSASITLKSIHCNIMNGLSKSLPQRLDAAHAALQ